LRTKALHLERSASRLLGSIHRAGLGEWRARRTLLGGASLQTLDSFSCSQE